MMYHHYPNIVNKLIYVFELTVEIFNCPCSFHGSWKFFMVYITLMSSFPSILHIQVCSQILHLLQCLDKTWTSRQFPLLIAVTTPFGEECLLFCHEPSAETSQFTRPASARINGSSCALALNSTAAFTAVKIARISKLNQNIWRKVTFSLIQISWEQKMIKGYCNRTRTTNAYQL